MFDPEHLNFHFPLFTTCFHMLVQFSFASLVLFFLPRFRPRYDSLTNPHNIHISDADQLQHQEESKKPLMTRTFYFTRIGPCGLATGLDIGLGNMSLKFITLTFYSLFTSSNSRLRLTHFSNVQILLIGLCPPLCVRLSTRISVMASRGHYSNNDCWCDNDGSWRSGF